MITSSPGASGRSSRCEQAPARASRFACEPEPTSRARSRPAARANAGAKRAAKRPSVSQPSSEASISASSSGAPITRPATGTVVSPATNSLGASTSSA